MHNAPSSDAGTSVDADINLRYVVLVSIIGALGGLLFGYDWVVIGGAKLFYENYFSLTTEQMIGWANSCALLGCLAGSIFSGKASDRFGRKKLLILAAVLFAVSSIFTGWSYSFLAFIVWRVLGGVAIGVASNISPIYIAEMSPAKLRGRLVSLNQMTIVLGVLLAQIVNWLIAQSVPSNLSALALKQSWNVQYGWRWMFTAVAVPSVVFFVSALMMPESPRWLAINGRRQQALTILKKVGGDRYADAALAEIEGNARVTEATHFAQLTQPGVLRVLMIGICLAVLQQWSGINIIFNYAEEIYRSAGYDTNGILFNIVITGSISMVSTLLALGFVDKRGRRPLMLLGCAGIGLSHLLIGLAYQLSISGLPILILTLCAIAFYSMSLAPITWVIISEIFPGEIRGTAVSISVSALWIASFILTFTFPLIHKSMGSAGTFWLYAAICAAGYVFIYQQVPETKGRSLEQIEAGFRGD